MAKSNPKVELTETPDGTITWTFANGAGVTVANPSNFSAEIQRRLAVHGLRQKLSDMYGAKDITPEIAFALQSVAHEGLLAGTWSSRRAAGAPQMSALLRLATAIANVRQEQGKDEDTKFWLERVEKADKAKRRQYASIPEVAAEIAKLKAGDASALDILDEDDEVEDTATE